MKIEQILQVKEQVKSLQSQINKAQGAIEQILKQLQEEFGISSIEEAKEYLKKLEQQEAQIQEKLEKCYNEFVQKWNSLP